MVKNILKFKKKKRKLTSSLPLLSKQSAPLYQHVSLFMMRDGLAARLWHASRRRRERRQAINTLPLHHHDGVGIKINTQKTDAPKRHGERQTHTHTLANTYLDSSGYSELPECVRHPEQREGHDSGVLPQLRGTCLTHGHVFILPSRNVIKGSL